MLELADIDLADERRDVLVVLVAGLGLGDADLAQLRGVEFDDGELGDVATELVEALHGPRRDEAAEHAHGNAVLLLEMRAHGLGIEETERALEDRTDLVAGLQHVDRARLHEILEALGERGLAAADGPEQVEDLLPLLETLRSMTEVADDALDRVLETVEILEGRIDLDRPVHEDTAQARVVRRVDHGRLANGFEHPLGCRGVHRRILAAALEVVLQRHYDLLLAVVALSVEVEDLTARRHCSALRCFRAQRVPGL